jgi:hypothetical protein
MAKGASATGPRMGVPPNLKPKTRFNQHTVGKDPNTSVQYGSLKSAYVEKPHQLKNYVRHLKSTIKMDRAILEAEEGIYTWILKRGHLYATKLVTNQEIGTLHSNLDALTLHRNNIKHINKNTLKNGRTNDTKPTVAGELLLVTAPKGAHEAQDEKDPSVRLYFNIQSGTFSEPLIRKCAIELGLSRGLNEKQLRRVPATLKHECRDDIAQRVQQELARLTGLPAEQVRFLSCSEEIQRELEAVPFLQGVYTHGPCQDGNEYHENIAGRNLIRRFMAYTSVANQGLLNMYFNIKPAENASLLGKRSTPNTSVVSNATQSQKKPRKKTGGKTKKNNINKQR